MTMYAVAGVTGQTGAATANALLQQGLPLRVIVRGATKAKHWADKGAEIAVADLDNVAELKTALNSATAAYLLNPPAYGADDPFVVAEQRASIYAQAINASDVDKVVILSSISAHLPSGNGIIHTNHIFEKHLATLAKPVTFLRPGYFFENWSHVLNAARIDGILPSMLSPLSRAIPMVSVSDIGALAAKLMQETWIGRRVVELAGPTNTTPDAVASILSESLGKPVKTTAVPREVWSDIFAAGGMSPQVVAAFVEMLEGFNNGTIRFQGGEPRRGKTTASVAITQLLNVKY